MIECSNTSHASTYRNGGVLMSCLWHVTKPDLPVTFDPAVEPHQLESASLQRMMIGARTLHALLDLRRAALETLVSLGGKHLEGLEELISEALAELPLLERQLYGTFFAAALESTFDFSYFESVMSFLPETGKAFLRAFKQTPTLERAETLYMWCTDLDRTVMDYLRECSPSFGSVMMTISQAGYGPWITECRGTVAVPASLCAG